MLEPSQLARSRFGKALLIAVLVPMACGDASSRQHSSNRSVSWTEGAPGCTFNRGEDGTYRYGFVDGDLGITVAVDSQELEKTRRRVMRVFAVLLTIRYRGTSPLSVSRKNISLDFVGHSHITQASLDPDDLSARIQVNKNSFIDEIEREIHKHPEKREAKEAMLKTYLKDSNEMQSFLNTSSLRSVQLGPPNPEANGWVFFGTESKWIGKWKRKEDFVLRIPLEDLVLNFPFSLPPEQGDLILRHRVKD